MKFLSQKITKLKQNYKAQTFQLCNFLRQNIGKKSAHKMLMKLTPGGNPIKETFK
jgi:hypothetical protein